MAEGLTITAIGFELRLNTSVLVLEHAVVARGEESDVSSDSSCSDNFTTDNGGPNELSRVQHLEAHGNVRILDKAKKSPEAPDEAITDLAGYDGETAS